MDYGLGLTTISSTNLQKLDRIQNETMRTILGTTRDTPTEAVRYILDFLPIHTRQKVARVKAYFSVVENSRKSLHEATKDTKGNRLQRGKSWMGQAEHSFKQVCQLTELKQEKEWVARVSIPAPALLPNKHPTAPWKTMPGVGSRRNRLQSDSSWRKLQRKLTSSYTQMVQSQNISPAGDTLSNKQGLPSMKTALHTDTKQQA